MNKEKRRVPKLRFPGFTEDWEQRKLGECMNSFAYGLNAAAKDYDGMHKYIRITDIDDETHNFIQSNLTSPDIDFNMDVSDYKLNVGDIVFARTGASVGKTYLYNPNDGDLYYAGFLIRGEVKEDCDAGFIYQNTLTKEYDSFIRITSQRSGQPGVNSKEYATFKLNIPCKDEQEKISKVLNSLDELYTLHQRKLEHLNLKKKALLQKLFPKNGARYPELRFPGFTDAWEQRKLDEVCNVYDGTHQTPRYTNSGVMFVSVEDIETLESNKYITEEDFKSEFKVFPEYGDILLTRIGDVGSANVILDEIKRAYYVSLALLKPKNINSLFLLALLGSSSVQSEIWRRTLHIAFPKKINKNEINKVIVKQPSIPEQEKIGKLFFSLDQTITLHQRKLEHLQLQKKALLQQMFV